MKQQYQQQYVTSLLGDNEPTDFHSKLWEWYEKDEKPKWDKFIAQDAANEQRRLEIQKTEGLVPLIDKLSKAGIAGLKLRKVLDTQAEKRKAKEKSKFWQNWEAMDRSKSDVDYDLYEQNIFKAAANYDGDENSLWEDETRLRELTANLPTEIRDKYHSLSPSEILWAREYQGLRLLDTLTNDQFLQELTADGKYQEYLKSDNKSHQYKAWMLDKLAPYEFSDGQLSKVLYKGLNRLSSTSNGKNLTSRRALRLSNKTEKFIEQMTRFNSPDANSDKDSSGVRVFGLKLKEDAIDLTKAALNEANINKLKLENAERKSKGLAPLKDLPEDQLITKLIDGKLSNGLTPQTQALINLSPTLNAAARSRKLNFPEFVSREITGHDGKITTNRERFFSSEEGQKIYNSAMHHWESGSAAAVAEREAAGQQKLVAGLDKCQQGLCTIEDVQQLSFDWIRIGGSTENKHYKTLQSLNLTALTGVGLAADTKRVDHALTTGSFMSERNKRVFKNIGDSDLNKKINDQITKTEQSQTDNTYPIYKTRLNSNKLGLNLNGNKDVLRNDSTGDARMDRLATDLTHLQEVLYQKHLNKPGGETDFDIGIKVTTEFEKIKEANGYYVNIGDPGEGIWSKDGETGHRTNYYNSLTAEGASDFSVTKALGEKPTLTTLIRWDNNFNHIKQTVAWNISGAPGQTYVNQISNTYGLVGLDSFVAGTSGTKDDGFVSTAEVNYYSSSLRNIGERTLLLRQGKLLLDKAKTDPELKKLVELYGVRERIKKLEIGVKKEADLVETVQKDGDQYLQTIVGIDPKRLSENDWQRLLEATPSSNLADVKDLQSFRDAPINFSATSNLTTPPENIDLNKQTEGQLRLKEYVDKLRAEGKSEEQIKKILEDQLTNSFKR